MWLCIQTQSNLFICYFLYKSFCNKLFSHKGLIKLFSQTDLSILRLCFQNHTLITWQNSTATYIILNMELVFRTYIQLIASRYQHNRSWSLPTLEVFMCFCSLRQRVSMINPHLQDTRSNLSKHLSSSLQ